jgi:hypothetical protein
MLIDGRAANTGTIIVGPGQRAQIALPWGMYSLKFDPFKQPQNVSISVGSQEIVFDGTDNALGIAINFTLPLVNNQTGYLTLVVYAVGDGNSATRIVHYTAS